DCGGNRPPVPCSAPEFRFGGSTPKLGFVDFAASDFGDKSLQIRGAGANRVFVLHPVTVMEGSKTSCVNGKADFARELRNSGSKSSDSLLLSDPRSAFAEVRHWKFKKYCLHKCSVDKIDRQELLQQKGCVIWITGLSGSGCMFYVTFNWQSLLDIIFVWTLEQSTLHGLGYYKTTVF
ncbi:unnamed protein product, partial [Thlaspi arvense]